MKFVNNDIFRLKILTFQLFNNRFFFFWKIMLNFLNFTSRRTPISWSVNQVLCWSPCYFMYNIWRNKCVQNQKAISIRWRKKTFQLVFWCIYFTFMADIGVRFQNLALIASLSFHLSYKGFWEHGVYHIIVGFKVTTKDYFVCLLSIFL